MRFRSVPAGSGARRRLTATSPLHFAPVGWHAGPLIRVGSMRSWFTTDSLAAHLQVSDRMIRKWVAQGRLRSYKLDGCRRFDPADVDAFVAQFRDRRGAGR